MTYDIVFRLSPASSENSISTPLFSFCVNHYRWYKCITSMFFNFNAEGEFKVNLMICYLCILVPHYKVIEINSKSYCNHREGGQDLTSDIWPCGWFLDALLPWFPWKQCYLHLLQVLVTSNKSTNHAINIEPKGKNESRATKMLLERSYSFPEWWKGHCKCSTNSGLPLNFNCTLWCVHFFWAWLTLKVGIC